MVLSLWNHWRRPPYGGGNQFMLALVKGLQRRGITVLTNSHVPSPDGYLVNSIQFPVDRFRPGYNGAPLLHRIDGLIDLHRAEGYRGQDERVFAFNRQFATATVIQSQWAYNLVTGKYAPVRPCIVHNTVDEEVFHARARTRRFDPAHVRLIATSWSDNPRKGGDFYVELVRRLDPRRFQFTFVGNSRVRLPAPAVMVPAQGSEELAKYLRRHDIYVTASVNDACSNALLEGLACGLPALYRDSGGNPEIVKAAGLPFANLEDCLRQLDVLVAEYHAFQRNLFVPRLAGVVEQYLAALFPGSVSDRS